MGFTLKTLGFILNIWAKLNPKQAGALGLDLFCIPLAKKLKSHQKKYLMDNAYRSIMYRGKRIQTYRWGKGKHTILLLHGWGSHSYRWKKYIELLIENDYSVYAFDAPAHGNSEGRMLSLPIYKDIIQMMVAELGTVDAFIGHSFGGYALIYWLNQHSQQEDTKAVIMASPGEVSDFISLYKAKLALSSHASKCIDQAFYQRLNKWPEDFSTTLLAASFKYPCFIIHDEKDTDTHFQYSVKLHSIWKNSELLLTKGLGHSLKSPLVTTSILQFLKKSNAYHFKAI